MNGEFKKIIMDKNEVIEMFETILDDNGNKVAISMEGKSKTKYDEEIEIFIPTSMHSNGFGTTRGMTKFRKQQGW